MRGWVIRIREAAWRVNSLSPLWVRFALSDERVKIESIEKTVFDSGPVRYIKDRGRWTVRQIIGIRRDEWTIALQRICPTAEFSLL